MGNRINTVFLDCDGTLASNNVWYFRSGDVARQFSTYDGEGIAMLKDLGIRVIVITKSRSDEIRARAKHLGIEAYLGIENKRDFIAEYVLVTTNAALDRICFMGNDTNDLEAMKIIGYPACPKDANYSVLSLCGRDGYVSTYKGGFGAVRDLAEYLITIDFMPRFFHPPLP